MRLYRLAPADIRHSASILRSRPLPDLLENWRYLIGCATPQVGRSIIKLGVFNVLLKYLELFFAPRVDPVELRLSSLLQLDLMVPDGIDGRMTSSAC